MSTTVYLERSFATIIKVGLNTLPHQQDKRDTTGRLDIKSELFGP